MIALKPAANFCFGRDTLIENILATIRTSRSALLFGGRLSGKTTLLKRMSEQLRAHANTKKFGLLDLPIYVDLMALAAEAGPSEFFRHLLEAANKEAASAIDGYFLDDTIGPEPETCTIESFSRELLRMRQKAGQVDIRFLFLIDEAKRITGGRMPRGLQDNIFCLLYGADSEVAPYMSIIFAGAQDLYKFSEDDTSPIGSRASRHFLYPLEVADVESMITAISPAIDAARKSIISQVIHEQTGGHAGISRLLCDDVIKLELNDSATESNLADLFQAFSARCEGVLKVWNSSFSPEASLIRDELGSKPSLTIVEAAGILQEAGIDRFLAKKATEELIFTGVANKNGNLIFRANCIFWDYVSAFSTSKRKAVNKSVWEQIEAVELGFRELVRKRYKEQWPADWETKARQALGEMSWNKIASNLEKGKRQYKYIDAPQERDHIDCMYIGQMLILMVSAPAWHLFNHIFRDKRQAEDLFAAITPVRNDKAHFAQVPEKELDRCRIACDDLLIILDRARSGVP